MATVYLAADLRHDRLVALKVLDPDLGATLGAERFLREIKTTAQLQHPHILPLFDSGSAGDLLYYVMPYVEGETLADRVRRDGSLPVREALRLIGEVLGALAYAHRQGVVHRDIKPSNILLSRTTGHALVADFGIARALRAAEVDTITRPGVAIGTPAYMAPEQALGADVTPGTDVYAAGLVLYEALTGKRYPPPDHRSGVDWSAVPGAVRAPLRRAVQPAATDRWTDADAFRTALRGGAGGEPAWKLPVGIAAVAVLATALFMLARSTAPPPAPTADARLVVFPFTVRGGGDLDYLGSGMVDLLSAKLDGAGTWRLADPRAVLSLVGRELDGEEIDPAVGRRAAQRLDASLFVLGNIVDVGRQVRLDAGLYGAGPDPAPLARASVEGDRDDVLDLLDDLAAELLGAYGGASDARLTATSLLTTASLPALKSYLRGVRALRLGEFPAAADAFGDAIAADSGFALAWYQLSITGDWLAQPDLAREAADEAARRADRLPERERQLLAAMRVVRGGDADSAERMFRAILGTHPDDVEAASQLAELLFHFGPRQRRPLATSRDAWLRLMRLDPNWPASSIHLARAAASVRDLRALDTLSRRARELAPAGDRGLEMLILRLLLDDGPALRQEVARELEHVPDDAFGEVGWSAATWVRTRSVNALVFGEATAPGRSRELRTLGFGGTALAHAFEGRWAAAASALDTMTALDSVGGPMMRGHLAQARTTAGDTTWLRVVGARLSEGDWSTIPNSANRGVWFSAHDRVHEPIRLYLVGLANALGGDGSTADAIADRLTAMDTPVGSGSLVTDLAWTIRGAAAWRAGRVQDARAHLERVRYHASYHLTAGSGFYSLAFTRYLHGLVLEAAGRPDEALAWYGTFVETSLADLVYAPMAALRCGKILEAQGDREAARRQYDLVVTWLADGDPEVQPLVEEARRRLAALAD